jgi:hypothetical protein
MPDLPDEITLKLRYTGNGYECNAPMNVVLKRALKVLKRRFGLHQYKRGPANPPEVIVLGEFDDAPRCERCKVVMHYDIKHNLFQCADCGMKGGGI